MSNLEPSSESKNDSDSKESMDIDNINETSKYIPKCLQVQVTQKINLTSDIQAINADIHVLFNKYNKLYFDSVISFCEIKWIDTLKQEQEKEAKKKEKDNKHHKHKHKDDENKDKKKKKKKSKKKYGGQCVHDSSGFCSIELDQAILQFKSTKYLIETLIHQMIHSYLYQISSTKQLKKSQYDSIGHSYLFKQIINLINKITSSSSIKLTLNNKQCKHNDDVPSEIIPYQIYLGNIHHALNRNVLNKLGITHIVNCTQSIENKFESDGITYCRVPVNDKVGDSIMHFFVKAIRFIEEVKNHKNNKNNSSKIMIHCHAGISRSATITVAYLMYSWHLPMFEAITYVQGKRYIIQPNDGFKNQLLDFYLYLGQNEGNLVDFEKKYKPNSPRKIIPVPADPNNIVGCIPIMQQPQKPIDKTKIKTKEHVACPVCNKFFPKKNINKHLDKCLG